jgi:hypothetical protein
MINFKLERKSDERFTDREKGQKGEEGFGGKDRRGDKDRGKGGEQVRINYVAVYTYKSIFSLHCRLYNIVFNISQNSDALIPPSPSEANPGVTERARRGRGNREGE